MAQTLTRLLVHVIFSTKHRSDLIVPEIEPQLYPYMATIGRTNQSPVLAIGGTTNHVHLLVSQSKNIALSDLVMVIKKDSSKWIKTKGTAYRDFHWQDGYGGFTIGESQVENVRRYLARQKTHHRRVTFQDQFIEFLKKYNAPYDPRYIWD